MKTATAEALEWYRTRSNLGRGRLTSESSRLIKAGFLKLKWLSRTEWMLSITDAGRLQLNPQTP